MITICDGVVVGSKIIELLENEKREEICEFIQATKQKEEGISLFFFVLCNKC